jgi:hypothetical protein
MVMKGLGKRMGKRRSKLELTAEESRKPEVLTRSGKTQRRIARRAEAMKRYAQGEKVGEIARQTGLSPIPLK